MILTSHFLKVDTYFTLYEFLEDFRVFVVINYAELLVEIGFSSY
jgi:hypothetical protein